MKSFYISKMFVAIFIVVFAFTSCDEQTPTNTLVDAVERVPNFTPVPGGENVSIKVNRNSRVSYFDIEMSNIGENPYISEGVHHAWCVLYDIPVDYNDAEYNGVKLYSTKGDEKWKHVNYMLNKAYLYPIMFDGVTWREIQVAIWAVGDFRDFDLETVDVSSLPGTFRDGDQPRYNKALVEKIVADVEKNASSFDYDKSGGHVILMETDGDTQNLITFTPGGWGAPPAGNNPGQLLHDNFDDVYPDNFVVGIGYTITFTEAEKITDFLPITGGNRGGGLSTNYIDPEPNDLSSGKSLAQQTIALKLNIDFNNAGLLGTTDPLLKDLYVVDPASHCYGWTVEEVLLAAEEILGGGDSSKDPSITADQIKTCADNINNNFGDGEIDKGFLGIDDPTTP